jgi:hypothetical protein
MISITGAKMDVCLMEMEWNEEFSKGVRLEMLAAAYGSKWAFPQSLSTPCTPNPFDLTLHRLLFRYSACYLL